MLGVGSRVRRVTVMSGMGERGGGDGWAVGPLGRDTCPPQQGAGPNVRRAVPPLAPSIHPACVHGRCGDSECEEGDSECGEGKHMQRGHTAEPPS